ncbi:hypothetical protein PG999_005360 [Apiospora kogelbergensis]|uniref:Uncharacterized protein n=1 Tax=Apiospora kogelbergensis TaxID=1337665 RepID=A0AAW0R1U7_9PEZI
MTMTYVSPEGHKLVTWLSVFTALVFSILGLRFYVITRLNRRPLRLEDGAILVSGAGLLAMDGTTFWGGSNYQGERLAASYIRPDFFQDFIPTNPPCLAHCVRRLDLDHLDLRLQDCSPAPVPRDIPPQPLSEANGLGPGDHQRCLFHRLHQLLHDTVRPYLGCMGPSALQGKLPTTLDLGNRFRRRQFAPRFAFGYPAAPERLEAPDARRQEDRRYHHVNHRTCSHLELWLGILTANMPTLGPLVNRIPVGHVKKYLISDKPSKRGLDVRLASWKGLASGSRAPRGNDLVKLPGESGISKSHGGISRSQEYEALYSQPEIA